MFIRLAWFLWGAIVVALIAFPYSAHGAPGDRVAGEPPNDYIVIATRKCTANVAALVVDSFREKVKHAIYFQRNGQQIPGCWMEVPEYPGQVFTFWDDGDQFVIPVDRFKPASASSRTRMWDA